MLRDKTAAKYGRCRGLPLLLLSEPGGSAKFKRVLKALKLARNKGTNIEVSIRRSLISRYGIDLGWQWSEAAFQKRAGTDELCC